MSQAQVSDLLIELGTEELPPQALLQLADAFARVAFDELKEAGMLTDEKADFAQQVALIATPRRLGFILKNVHSEQPQQIVERRGPSVSAAFDDNGEVTKAAAGFARSCGVAFDQLERLKTDKGEWLFYKQTKPGQPLNVVLAECLQKSIKQLPIPKRMRWGDSEVEFVRPVHWLMALHGEQTVDIELLGLNASNQSRGHRFYCAEPIIINSVTDYFSALESRGHVIADFRTRRDMISAQIEEIAAQENAVLGQDDSLLDIVTALVEWPKAIVGQFDKRFLQMPDEVLISSMTDHQKYFHLFDNNDELLPRFITVSNIDSKDMQRVVQGNERVLRARLSDAEFFWKNDQKVALLSRYESLDAVRFHHKLGSLKQKVERVSHLASNIAEQLGADQSQLQLAAKLCKADLTTEMVGEFPELQGLVGYHYAINNGVDKQVANAVMQHYYPRFAGDQLPQSSIAQALAIADRLDSLTGIFACGEIPTGDKDPYALRRAALGVLRIITENTLMLDLKELLVNASENVRTVLSDAPDTQTLSQQVFDFILERCRSYYQEQGIHAESIASVMAIAPTHPALFDKRLRALSHFIAEHPDKTAALAAANKRIANILAKNGAPEGAVDTGLLQDDAENKLYADLQGLSGEVSSAANDHDYANVLMHLSGLQQPLDNFFEHVMVMADDKAIRDNRLRLLNQLRALFLTVADISLLRVD